MKTWELIAGLLALAAGMWAQIQSIFHWIKGFVVATHWTDGDIAAKISSYLVHSKSPRSSREKVYSSGRFFVKPLGGARWVAWEAMRLSGGVLWWNKRPLWYDRQKDAKGGAFDEDVNYKFGHVRGTVNFEDLIVRAIGWASERSESGTGNRGTRHSVTYHHGKSLGGEIAQQRNEDRGSRVTRTGTKFSWDDSEGNRLLKWTAADLGATTAEGTFASLALSDEVQAAVDHVKLWKKSEKWYQKRGIPWRLGMLLEGVGGSGKTSAVRAIGEEMDMPVHIFDLATMSNEDLREAWSEMAADAPCIALIEDIDAIFDGRKNISKAGGMMSSGGLTFDALLNCIDGIERHDGVLLMITTNYPDKIDPALAKRGGRVDRTVTFKALDLAQRLKVAEMILGAGQEAFEIANASGDTPAGTFVETCCRVALKSLYAEAGTSGSDPYRSRS